MACILDVESYLTVGCHGLCSLLASNQDVILIVTLLGIEKDFCAWPEIISTFQGFGFARAVRREAFLKMKELMWDE